METLVTQNYDLAFRLSNHLAMAVQAGGTSWWARKPRMATFLGSDGNTIEVPESVLAGLITALMPLLASNKTVTITIGPPRADASGATISDVTVTPVRGYD